MLKWGKIEIIPNASGADSHLFQACCFPWGQQEAKAVAAPPLCSFPELPKPTLLGHMAWWPSLTQLFFSRRTFYQRKPITVQPTVPRRCSSKTPRTIKSYVSLDWNSWRRFFFFPCLDLEVFAFFFFFFFFFFSKYWNRLWRHHPSMVAPV